MNLGKRLLSAILLISGISALSLSYRMRAHEPRACFYVPITDPASVIQLYFSVTNSKSYDDNKAVLNMVVQSPKGQQLHSITNQGHAEISLKPIEVGDHSICFMHGASPTDKTIDLDISLTNPDGTAFIPNKEGEQGGVLTQATADAATKELEKRVSTLNGELHKINTTLKYLKNREKRNMETVNNVDKVIFYFSFFETLLICGMSLCQVAILRHFFSRSGRPRV